MTATLALTQDRHIQINTTRTLVAIDSAVDNYQFLLDGILPNTEVIVLCKESDGIVQIAETLANHQIDSLQIIAHGHPGNLQLGNSQLNLDTIDRYRTLLQQWQVAEISIYSCEVAAGDAGSQFITSLHQITGANIAASTKLVGNARLGGDWELNQTTAEMVVSLALKQEVMSNYAGVLVVNNAPSFNAPFANNDGDGKVTTDLAGRNDYGRSVTLQSDGKFLVAGYSSNGSNDDFALVRYNSNGSLDTTFSSDGKVTQDISNRTNQGYSVAVQPDNKIIVAGHTNNGSNDDFAILRYNPDGSLDTTFDTDGIVIRSGTTNEYARSVTVQTDGKIVVAGYIFNGSNFDFAILRYNPNGTLDNTLDGDGILSTDFGGNEEGKSVIVQPDGKIIVSGTHTSLDGRSADFGIVRYNTNGTLDNTFDGDGKLAINVNGFDQGLGLTLQADGKILMSGGINPSNNYDFGLVRYNSNGSLDTTFDGDGKLATAIGGGFEFGYSVTVQTDGKILVGGYSANATDD